MSYLGTHVERLAEWSCEKMRADIDKRGDRDQWAANFDGFYLTRGHHSNNSSATVHDIESDRIAWFTHHTKQGRIQTGLEHQLELKVIYCMIC